MRRESKPALSVSGQQALTQYAVYLDHEVDRSAATVRNYLSDVQQFIAWPTIVLALTMGCVIIIVMQYLMFSSVVRITSENFFAVSSLSPLTTLVLQELAVRAGFPLAGAAGWGILPFMLLILLGNLLIAWRGGAPAGERMLATARKGSL